ncbi:MAG: Hsp20/alpha crystallin family protein [Bryobacteraceae bacterium]
MDSFVKVRWLRGEVAVTQVQLWQRAPAAWQPPINAFRCETCVRICVDLAGVEKSAIDLHVEPRRVIVRGERRPPEPADGHGRALQVLALEIDYGRFERELHLPAEVDVERAHAEQENGLLWISLPLKQ